MNRSSSSRSSLPSSSRSKESSSSSSRSSRTGASARGRSPRRSRSPSPRGRRRRRSPSSSRSSRRSPLRRTSRARSPSRDSRSRRGSEQRDGSLSRRRSPGRRSRSPGRRSHSPGRRSPSRLSESSVEQSLRITVGNDHYGIDTPERRRLSDRLGSPVDSLSDVERDDLAEGPIFSRGLLRPQSLERYSSREHSPPSPFSTRHDEDYRSRDVFLHQSNYSMNYEHLQDISRDPDRDGELLRKSSYQSEEKGREPKRPRYDREDRTLAVNIEHQSLLPGTRNYRKRSISRSPSPTYLDEDFRELESARRKREKEELSRNSSRDLHDNDCVIPGLTNMQSTEPRYLYRPDEAPAMPKKSILKKRVDDSSVQPEVFSSSSASVKELPLPSHPPPLLQRSSTIPFSLEVENFLKRFNKNAVAESANKDSQASIHDWKPFSGLQQNTFPSEQNFGSFLRQQDNQESAAGSADRQGDFLLPHERASQDGSGFSRILGMMADSTSAQEKRRRSFPDIEDEEKFLYGGDEDDSNINSLSTEKLTVSEKEPVSQKSGSPSSPTQSVKPNTLEESRPEYEKIHDLLKTIGLDIGVAEIGKLAARTEERLHGKKTSRSPDRHSVVSRKPDSGELRRSRSNTRSPESNKKRSLSPSGSFPPSRELSSTSELEHTKCKTLGHSNSAGTPERSVPPVPLIPSAPPSLPNLPPAPTPVPQYSVSRFSPFTATQLPQNYPTPTMAPPGYDAYGHYMAYAASGWPMYAPPRQSDPAIQDVHGLVSLSVPPNPTRPNLRVIETVSTGKGTPEIKRDESVLVQIPTTPTYSRLLPHLSQTSLRGTAERMADEKNRASQKQKVIEEREKLKVEQEARQKKLHYLRTELDRLSKQQGEMLRKKRREKDGHKDPLLVEVNRLQENIVKEITQLQIETETAEKKQSELDKVAQILGINIFEKSRKQSAESKDSTEKNKSENTKSQEKTSSSNKESKPTNDKPKGGSPKPTESCLQPSKQHFQSGNIYDYYDTGNHWCKDCNTICGTMFDFFTHMHNKKHRQTLDPYNRPWASKTQTESKQNPMKHLDKIPLPAKGSEFLIPVTGYYCQLCHEFFGDQISAEQHVKSHPHNEKYKKHMDENPVYEERRNLDRQAGLSVIQETERRLKRKQCEKPKDDRDENNAKVARKEESKPVKELGDESNEHEISQRKEGSNGQKFGIKLKLKKDDKEAERKEGKKEESQKESRQSSFGKFSWRKTEKDDKNQCKDVASPKEECIEEGKDKESKSQSGKSNSKPIAIKLSGKTVIPHTSPWTPVVPASSQAKIRPNLPVPVMVLRKSATTTVSKPAPLNTFLSIKSSGATTKPLPVVKEGNPELVLPPDIISKAFGGEVVVLKGSQENVKLPEQAETQVQEAESVTKAVEHAKALENVKASMEKVQEQAMLVAKAQAKARELAVIAKEQELARLPKMHEQPHVFERPHRRPPLLPLPPRPPLPLLPPRPTPLLFRPPSLLPPKQTPLILADDMAPGVSEDDKNILVMPMCPRPLPPPTIFKDHVKKMEKKNTCLAAGNAKDLYDIFYNNSGRSPADNKLAEKGKLSPVEKERSTEMLMDSKPIIHSAIQETLQNVDSSSDVSKISASEGTQENEIVKSENVWTASKENIEIETCIEGESQKISLSDSQNTSTYMETAKSNDLQSSASLPLQNKQEIGATASAELCKESLEFSRAELAVQIRNRNVLPADEVSKKPAELESAELAMQLPEEKTPLEDVNKNASELHTTVTISSDNEPAILSPEEKALSSKKPVQFETAEFTMAFPDSSTPSLVEELSKNSSELQTAIFISSDNELATVSSEGKALSLQDIIKKPIEIESAESTMAFIEISTPPLLEELSKSSSELRIAAIVSSDNVVATASSKGKALSLQEDSKKSIEIENAESIMASPESSSPLLLEEVRKNSSELQTAVIISSDNVIATASSEGKALSLQEDSKKSIAIESAESIMASPENRYPLLLEEVRKNSSELQAAAIISSDNVIATVSSEDKALSLQEDSKKSIEIENAESIMASPESSSPLLLEEVRKNSSELQAAAIISSDNVIATASSEGEALSLQEDSKKSIEIENAESIMASPESSSPLLLEEVRKNSSELQAAAVISCNVIATVSSEGEALSLQEDSKKSIDIENAESIMASSESSSPLLLEEVRKNSSELQAAAIISCNVIATVSSEGEALSLQEDSKKSLETENTESIMASPESSSPLLLEEVRKNSSELQAAEIISSDNVIATASSEGEALSLQEDSKKSIEIESAESIMASPESSSPLLLEEVRKNSSELQTAEIISSDNVIATASSEGKALSLQEDSKKSIEIESAESIMASPESSSLLLEEVRKNSSELQTAAIISPDTEVVMVLSKGKSLPLQDVCEKPVELETAFPESNTAALLEEFSKNSSELHTAVFVSSDNKVITPLSEDEAFVLQEVGKKPTEFGTAELAMTLPERSVSPLEVISKNVSVSELQTAELIFVDSKKLITQLSEDSVPLLENISKKPPGFENTEIAMQLPERNAAPLEEVHNNTSQLQTVAFKTLDNKELVTPLPENDADYSKGTLAVIDDVVTHGEDISQKPRDQQKMEVHYKIENDLEMETDVSILGDRDVERKHMKLAVCHSDISQGDPESQLLEITEANQMNDSSELTVSAWVSDVCVQSQLVWQQINTSSEINEENPRMAETGQGSCKGSVDLQLGNVRFDRLESTFSEESSQASMAQNMDPELKTLNKSESDSFNTNSKEEGLLANMQQKAGEDVDVGQVLESRNMSVDCLVNVTMTSCIQEKHEEISQQSLSCETKDLHIQGTEDLCSISSSNDAGLSSGVELIFIKDNTQGPSKSMEFSEETGSIEKENFTRVQPTAVQEPLDVLPAEFGVENLGEEALSFTGMNTEVLNTSTAGDFDLHTTYSELGFDQSATLTLNLNVENDRDAPKSNEIKPTDPSRLKAHLELETIDFSLGDIDVDREHLDILPPEILNEDSVESPKLETIASVCLEASKTIELGINQPGVESEVLDFAALTSGEQDDKLHPLVSDVVDPHMVSPAANNDSVEPDTQLFKMQCMPPISEALLKTDSKVSTSDMLSLSCDGRCLQSNAAECMEPLLPNPKEISLEVGGSGDCELYVVKNEMQTQELTKMEEVESIDGRCEVNSKLASEETESSAEDLLL